MHPGDQRRDHRLGLAGAARELRVGRDRRVVQTLVIRYSAEEMGGVLRPTRQSKVDLGDRAVPVAREECAHVALKALRERTRTVVRRELGRAVCLESATRSGILAGAARDLPELEVHLGGWVVRQAAEHGLHLARARTAPEQAGSEGVRQHPGRDKADETREELGHQREDEALVRVEPLGRTGGDANTGDPRVDLGEQALARRVWSQKREQRGPRSACPEHPP